MSPERRSDGDFAWPPTEEDLDAIEVLELWRPSADTPTSLAAADPPPAAPGGVPGVPPTAPVPEPPATDEPVHVLHLDAHAGPKPYVVDLRPALPDQEWLPATLGEQAETALVWPPPQLDLDAFEVVDLTPRRLGPKGVAEPAAEDDSAPEKASGAAPGRAPVVRESEIPGAAPWPPTLSAWAVPADELVPERTARGWRGAALFLAAGLLAGAGWLTFDRVQREASPVADAATGIRDAAPSAPETSAGGPERTREGTSRPVVDDSLLADARKALASGDRLGAVDLVTNYLEGGGRDPAAAALAENVISAARSAVDRRRREAVERVGRAGGGDAMAAARRREAMAEQALRAGQFGAALLSFADAERAFASVQPAAVEPAPPAAEQPAASPASATVDSMAAVGAAPPAAVDTSSGTDVVTSPLRAATAPVVLAPPPPNVPALPAPGPATDASRPAPPGAVSTASAAGTDAAVRRVLQAYRSAYETLDADAAAAVYPSVDARALERAFGGLRSQTLDFDRCDITAIAGDRAQATCVGRLAFVPRVGSQAPRVEARRWTFALQREGDAWRIQRAQVGAR